MLLTLLYLLLLPLSLMLLAQRWDWVNKVSPMAILYLIGLAVGNIGIMGHEHLALCNTLSNLAIPLAIPLMLMGCSLKGFSLGNALKVFLSGLLAILITTISGFFLFQTDSIPYRNMAQVCAALTGIYTGGIPNIGAISQGVGLPQSLYLIVTSADLIVTGLYLIFIIFLGKPLFRRLLPAKPAAVPTCSPLPAAPTPPIFSKGSLLVVGATLLIAALSYALALLCSGAGGLNMTILILALTTLSIVASLIPSVGRQKQSFDIGLYCVYVFCLALATQVNIHDLNLRDNIHILYYIAFTVFGSIALQILFARLLKIDGDSVMVASVALINSPPFVPMVAALLGNKDIMMLGIAIGLLGYLLGNYLGIGIYHLLILGM